VNGDIYVIGTTETTGFANSNGMVAKFDRNGNLIWSNIYGGNNWDELYDAEFDNNDLIVVGHTASFGSGNRDALAIKLNSLGDTIWTQLYGNSNAENIYKIVQTNDNNFVLCGDTRSIGQGNEDVLLIKINSNGDTLWTKSYGTTFSDKGFALTEDQSGNLYVQGVNTQFPNGVFLMKVDPNGVLQWTKHYQPSTGYFTGDENLSLKTTSENTIIATLYSANISGGGGNNDAILAEFDLNGNIIWIRGYGGFQYDDVKEVIERPTGFLAAGQTANFNAPTSNVTIYMLYTDSIGQTGCNEFVPTVNVQNLNFISESGLQIDNGISITSPLPVITSISVIDSVLCGAICTFDVQITGNTSGCIGDLISLSVPLGNIYNWSTGDNSNTISVSLLSDTTIYLTSSSGGCSDYDSILIQAVQFPNVIIGGDTVSCIGNVVPLSVPSGFSYSWSTGESGNSILLALNGDTTVFVTTTNGVCSEIDSVTVNAISAPDLTIIGDTVICVGSTENLTVSGATNYLWQNGDTINSTSVSLSTSEYFNVVGYIGGCSAEDSIYINVVSPPNFSVDLDTTITSGSSLNFSINGCDQVAWTPTNYLSCANCPNPVSTPSNSISYFVSCIDMNGCLTSDTINITELIIPNAFSPNGDLSNDTWEIVGISNYPESRVEIFNRWGDKVYEKSGYDNSWDGTFNGKLLPGGVYYFILDLDDDTQIKGSINIIF
jgi:gliding motility-associated-like protein